MTKHHDIYGIRLNMGYLGLIQIMKAWLFLVQSPPAFLLTKSPNQLNLLLGVKPEWVVFLVLFFKSKHQLSHLLNGSNNTHLVGCHGHLIRPAVRRYPLHCLGRRGGSLPSLSDPCLRLLQKQSTRWSEGPGYVSEQRCTRNQLRFLQMMRIWLDVNYFLFLACGFQVSYCSAQRVGVTAQRVGVGV